MNKQLWQRAQVLFEQSLTMKKNVRSKYLATNTAGEDELRFWVESMLLAEQDQSFMQSTPNIEVNEALNKDADQVFGHFTIIKKIAVGGMGRIYKAKSNSSDIDVYVALKLIRKELLSDQVALRFENEKAILGKLKHHHIAALIDAGVVDDTPYIATEWVEGESINEYVQNYKLSIDHTLNLFLQVCEAVAYAHNQLVIHRDLKPANILIDSNKQVKLLDFGIAKLIDNPSGQMTQTQVFTPDYAAPEQINGEVCTTTTDVYALGVLLFELLVGEKRFNFDDLSMAEKVLAIAKPKAVYASQVMHKQNSPNVQKVRGALDTIINQAMHADPKRRYLAVYELISDIKRYQQYLPIQAMGDGWIYRSRMFVKRNPWPSLLALLLLVSLSTGLMYSTLQKQQAQLAQQSAQTEAEKSQQMLNFFSVILDTAKPTTGGSTQITVEQMFKEGAEKFDLQAIEDPLLRAQIGGQIAAVYSELSDTETTLVYLREASAFYQSDLIQYADAFLREKINIAQALQVQDKNSQALDELTTAYQAVKSLSIDEHVMAELKLTFGEVHRNLNNNDLALEYLESAEELALKNELFGLLGSIKYYQYLLLQYSHSAGETEEYLTQAQQYYEQVYQDGHPNLLSVRNSLALKHKSEGDYLEALEVFDSLQQDHQKLYGRHDAYPMINHADTAYYLGNFGQTITMSQSAILLMQENELGKGFSFMAAHVIQARALLEQGQYAQAEQLLIKATRFFSQEFKSDHVVMWTLSTDWLDFYLKTERLAEYQGNVESIELMVDAYLNESKGTQRKYVNVMVVLASHHWQIGNKVAALEVFEAAQKVVEKISLKQEWSYWLIAAGVQQLRHELGYEFDIEELRYAKHKLFMLLGDNHWYHRFFKS